MNGGLVAGNEGGGHDRPASALQRAEERERGQRNVERKFRVPESFGSSITGMITLPWHYCRYIFGTGLSSSDF